MNALCRDKIIAFVSRVFVFVLRFDSGRAVYFHHVDFVIRIRTTSLWQLFRSDYELNRVSIWLRY